jgi:glyceraldehyde 3-phosphate dehydrogenase
VAKRIAINGFGRIGRTVLRAILLDTQAAAAIDVVAINIGSAKNEHLDLLFKHDSVMGMFPGSVAFDGITLTINNRAIPVYHETEPEKLPWKTLRVDCVVEATGAFTEKEQALRHCTAGAAQVVITAPSETADIAIILGVNHTAYNRSNHQIISLGSCTTNCFAPIVKVLHEVFELTGGHMTTIHAYTSDQVLLDNAHKDPRRARAAGLNMVPTKTGAQKLIAQLFPDLTSKISAVAIRVPTPVVSLLDFSFTTQKPFSRDAINTAFKNASSGRLLGVMQYEEEPLVSSDFQGNHASCIIDSLLTQTSGEMGKVFAWYDNEYGYSCRVRDFLLHNL